MPWRPYSTSAEPPDYEDDELMDDIDEGYTDFDGAFVDEGFSEDIEDGFECAALADEISCVTGHSLQIAIQ